MLESTADVLAGPGGACVGCLRRVLLIEHGRYNEKNGFGHGAELGNEYFAAKKLTSWTGHVTDTRHNSEGLGTVESLISELDSLSTVRSEMTVDWCLPLPEISAHNFPEKTCVSCQTSKLAKVCASCLKSMLDSSTQGGVNKESTFQTRQAALDERKRHSLALTASELVASPKVMSGKSLIEKRRFTVPQLPLLVEQRKVCDFRCSSDVCALLSGDFVIDEVLGKGALGIVYQAKQRKDGRTVTLKIMHSSSLEMQHTARKEFSTIQGLDHPNITSAIDILDVGGRVVQVFEHFASVSLDVAVRKSSTGRLQEATAHRLCRGLWSALEHLFTKGVLHRDIKPSNILVSSDFDDVRLIDFNVASTTSEGLLTPRVGDSRYMAPEVFSNSTYSVASDVYSSGLCLHFMLAAELPDHGCRRSQVSLCNACWSDVSESGKAVVSWCLAPEARHRPTPTQLMKGTWISADFGDTFVGPVRRLSNHLAQQSLPRRAQYIISN